MNKRDYVPTFSCAEVFIRHIYNNYSEAVVGSEIIFVRARVGNAHKRCLK